MNANMVVSLAVAWAVRLGLFATLELQRRKGFVGVMQPPLRKKGVAARKQKVSDVSQQGEDKVQTSVGADFEAVSSAALEVSDRAPVRKLRR